MKMTISNGDQEEEWESLYARIGKILGQFGKSDYMGRADYWVVDDNWGCRQHKVYITALHMLAPRVVTLLQSCLKEFPEWEIVVAVSLGEVGQSWPKMGLIIRPHEIVDDLQRQYFPKEFQRIEYEGSRRGPMLTEE